MRIIIIIKLGTRRKKYFINEFYARIRIRGRKSTKKLTGSKMKERKREKERERGGERDREGRQKR